MDPTAPLPTLPIGASTYNVKFSTTMRNGATASYADLKV